MTPCEIFKQRSFPRCSFSKAFSEFRINVSGGDHLQKICRSQVFKFTKDWIRLLVSLRILKIFRTAISWTPAASYFHYYVMPGSCLLHTRVFNCYIYFDGDSGRLLLTFCLITFHHDYLLFPILTANKLHLVELGLYNL